jgi:hypothetical protein
LGFAAIERQPENTAFVKFVTGQLPYTDARKVVKRQASIESKAVDARLELFRNVKTIR